MPPKGAEIVIYHATAAGNLPPAGALVEGELALDALSNPARLWTQVPTTRDPSGRIDLLKEGSVSLPVSIANGGTNAITAPLALDSLSGSSGANAGALSRSTAGVWSLNAYLPVNNPAYTGTLTGPDATLSADLTLTNAPLALPTTGVNGRVLFVDEPTKTVKMLNGLAVRATATGVLGLTSSLASNTASDGNYLYFYRSRAAGANIQNNDVIAQILFEGAPGVVGTAGKSGISVYANQTFTATAQGARMQLIAVPSNVTNPATFLTIGDARYGTAIEQLTAPTTDFGTPATVLGFRNTQTSWVCFTNASGTFTISNSTGSGTTGAGMFLSNVGNVVFSGTVTPTPSDIRLKDTIEPWTHGLVAIRNLNPISWRWNGRAVADDGIRHAGISAQEAEQVMPEAAVERVFPETERDDSKRDQTVYKGLDYNAVTAALVNAVKELDAEITALKAQRN